MYNPRKAQAIITLAKLINSNDIDAEIVVRTVIITPFRNGMKVLDASKLWFKGMAKGEYQESENSISGEYEWFFVHNTVMIEIIAL